MKYSYIFYAIIFTLMIGGIAFYNRDSNTDAPAQKALSVVDPKKTVDEKSRVFLDVPYVSEAPEGIWTQPWANSCEEASVMMVDKYYAGQKSVSIPEARAYILNLVAKQEERYESSRNADSMQLADMSRRFANFNTEIRVNPTMDEMKAEIIAGRPVLTFHRGFDLENPNLEFSPTLSSFHVMVLIGFDDEKKVFITHDPADEKSGAFHEYEYDLFMNSMHDYNAADNQADGPPTAVFTSASFPS